MCVILNDALSNGKYVFFAKVFNLASVKTISAYNSIGGNEPDGIMHDTLERIINLTDKYDDEWNKMLSLKWDAAHVAEKVVYNFHTHELIGFTHDAFDVDVLLAELEAQTVGNDDTDADDDDDDDSTQKQPVHAKQFLIFMVTNWETKMVKVKHVVARYACAGGIPSNFLISVISKIIVAACRYGLIINNIVGDGATENQSAERSLATLTAADVFKDFLTKEQKNKLPMDLKIAFVHPIRSDIIVFICADMPHLVKKCVNAMENSGPNKTRHLNFRGQKIELAMLEEIWKCDNGRFGDLRTNILTEDHFQKKSYSRMRVHLAVQVVSNSMNLLIQRHADKCGGKEMYEPFRHIILAIDR